MIEQTPGNDIKDYEDLQTGRSEQTSSFLEISMYVQLKHSTNSKYKLHQKWFWKLVRYKISSGTLGTGLGIF